MVSLCIFLCIYLFRLYVHKSVMHLELIFMCVKKDSNLFPQHTGVWFSQLRSKGLSPLLLCRLGGFTENPLACLCGFMSGLSACKWHCFPNFLYRQLVEKCGWPLLCLHSASLLDLFLSSSRFHFLSFFKSSEVCIADDRISKQKLLFVVSSSSSPSPSYLLALTQNPNAQQKQRWAWMIWEKSLRVPHWQPIHCEGFIYSNYYMELISLYI